MSDYLSEEEQLARLRGWWERHGLSLLIGVIVIVVAVVGWRWYQSRQAELVSAASDLYVAYQQAEGDEAEALARQVIDAGDGTAYPTLVLLDQARQAVAAGDAAAAEPLLRQAAELATGAVLADLAELRLARLLFALERDDDALTVLREVQGAGYRSLAAELKGDIHLARGERVLAHQSYVAAQGFVPAGEQRPVLEMKIADTANAADRADAADRAAAAETDAADAAETADAGAAVTDE